MRKLILVVIMSLISFSLVACNEKTPEDVDYMALYGPNFKKENLKPINKNNLIGM